MSAALAMPASPQVRRCQGCSALSTTDGPGAREASCKDARSEALPEGRLIAVAWLPQDAVPHWCPRMKAAAA